MTERILCVDDDSNILLGYQRALRKQFQIEVVLGGKEGLAVIRDQGPFWVVVADMRIARHERRRDAGPDETNRARDGSHDADGQFRPADGPGRRQPGAHFPLHDKTLPAGRFRYGALEAGLAQYRLVVAERELLSKTLSGSVKILTDVLSLVSPLAFGGASRVRGLARQMAQILGLQDVWMIEIAAMLSQLGCVAISEEAQAKQYRGEQLLPSEAEAIAALPWWHGTCSRIFLAWKELRR